MKLSKTKRLIFVLVASVAFFVVEIAIGFKTGALALIADAFHYLNDIISYAIALVATRLALRPKGPSGYTFALRRSEILGAFFNATFLIALAVSIVLQAIDRFIDVPEVDDPLWVLIVGCAGLGLNIVCMLVIHEHGHSHGGTGTTKKLDEPDGHEEPMGIELQKLQAPGRYFPTPALVDHSTHHHAQQTVEAPKNLGLAGVLVHLMGDAVNNVGVILAAAIMWKTDSPKRFYADPAVSLGIGLIIFASAVPLTLKSARVLLEAAPKDLDLDRVRADLQTITGVTTIHDFHIWHLTEVDLLASFHVRTNLTHLLDWAPVEREMRACLAAYGVTHVTIAPEFEHEDINGPPRLAMQSIEE